MKALFVLFLLAVSPTAHALPRTSATYTLSPESINGGGSRTSSTSYSHEGSLGDIGGLASVAGPAVTVLGGYIGAQHVVGQVPGVTTSPVTDLTATSATLSGEVTSVGGSEVTGRGFVVGTGPDPTVENDLLVPAGSGMATFTVPVTDLSPGTTYHLRAWATSEIGTGYGANIVFTTDTRVTFTNGIANFAREILAGDRQIFRFTLAGPRIVSFAAAGGDSLQAELFDDEGNLIRPFDGDSDFDLEQLLLAGDYAFHVFRQTGGGGAQSFVLEIDASVVAASRPDVTVGPSAGRLTGNSVFSPAKQIAGLTSKKLRAVTGFVSVANRGKVTDVLMVRGGRGSAFFKVVWSGPTGNVTAALNAGTYRTAGMDDGTTPVSLSANITPNKKKLTKKNKRTGRTTIVKKTFLLSVRAVSTFDSVTGDAATIQAKTR